MFVIFTENDLETFYCTKVIFVSSMFTWETPAAIEPEKEVGTGKRTADSLENKDKWIKTCF